MLTPQQLATLKADIAADPVLSALPNTPDNAFVIAEAYNATAVPDFYVWKQSVSEAEILNNGMNFTLVDGLTQGKRDEWSWIFRSGAANPSKANIRAGIIDIWSGTAPKVANQVAIWSHCQKLATRAEKLFSTGAGTAAVAGGTGPATTEITAQLTYDDVFAARSLP